MVDGDMLAWFALNITKPGGKSSQTFSQFSQHGLPIESFSLTLADLRCLTLPQSSARAKSPVQIRTEIIIPFRTVRGMMVPVPGMKTLKKKLTWLAAAIVFASWNVCTSEAKSYGGGHSHSYSSHGSSFGGGHSYSSGPSKSSGGGTSHSSGFGGNPAKSFSSGGGHSYGSGPSHSENDHHGYTSSKSYGAGGGPSFTPNSGKSPANSNNSPGGKPSSAPGDKGFAFDQAAARARKEESSKRDFTQYKDSQAARQTQPGGGSYGVRPPPISSGGYRTTVYVPDRTVLITRPYRIYSVFNPYYSRPWVVYRDPYGSFFWWWLLDRSLDDRAWWAYHHRYDMDPARYDALVASDQQLAARVAQLEAQQAARDPTYTPAGLDRDLMYSDHYVSQTYSNRTTGFGVAAFRLLGLATAAGVCGVFIWLIWFKRWQTST